MTTRYMEVAFEDGSTITYQNPLPVEDYLYYDWCVKAIETAANNLFERLKLDGKNAAGWLGNFPKNRDPGPKATEIVKVWTE